MLQDAHARSIIAARASCLDETTVTLFLDRRLPAPRASTVEGHIDGCGTCRRLLSALARGRSRELALGDRSAPAERHRSMHPRPRTRTRRWIAFAAALIALGAASFALAHRDGSASSCRDVERELAGVWDPQRRIAAHIGMLAAHAPAATIREAERALDRYASAWVAIRGDACEATRRRGEQSEHLLDLRMHCLDRRRDAVDALAAQLATVTPAAVPSVVYAVDALEPLADCANAGALAAQPALPENPAIPRWQREIAEARARGQLGDDKASETLAAAVAISAAAARVRSVEAEALLVEATAIHRRGDGGRADRVYRDAVLAAEASGADRVLAQARIARIAVATAAGQFDTAKEAVLAASAAVERAGGPTRLRAALTTQEGILAAARGSYGIARADFQATLELLGPLRETDDLDVARSTQHLGDALLALGKPRDAEAAYRRALELRRAHLGDAHPDVATSLIDLAHALVAQGRYAEAAAHFVAAWLAGRGS